MKRLSPRQPSARGPTLDSSDARLPDDVLAEQVQRLTVFALVSGGLWAIGLLMDAVVFPAGHRRAGAAPAALIVEACGVVVLAIGALRLGALLAPRAASDKSDAGLWLMLLNAADIALLETWATDPTNAMVGPPVVDGRS